MIKGCVFLWVTYCEINNKLWQKNFNEKEKLIRFQEPYGIEKSVGKSLYITPNTTFSIYIKQKFYTFIIKEKN